MIIDYTNSLVQIDHVCKRLPFKQRVDYVFGLITWDGERGVITHQSGGDISFTDQRIVQPFIDMFDEEPPQMAPESLGARRHLDGPDPEWDALVNRHGNDLIAIAELIESAKKAIIDLDKAQNEAAEARHKVFRDALNATRIARGLPAREYRDGDSFPVENDRGA